MAENSLNFNLVCKSVKYYSLIDEDIFFLWLKKIKCIRDIRGIRDELHLLINEQPSADELLSLIALFRRYKINAEQLEKFMIEHN